MDWATASRSDRSAYLIPLGLIYIVPLFLTVGLFFIPESPRWLILQDRIEDGHKSLKWLRPTGAQVDIEVAEIKAAIDKEREMGSQVGVLDMFKNPIDRRRTILAVCGVTLQAATGSMFIICKVIHPNAHVESFLQFSPAYKAYFFTMAKVANPFAMGCVLSAIGLFAIVLNSLIVVRYGRRRVLLMGGLGICGILQLIVAVVYDQNPGAKATGEVLVALSCLYMMSYNVRPETI